MKRKTREAKMNLLGEAVCETLWPTRCVICDKPGDVLCENCESTLETLDLWRACPKCGAAFGLVQCDHCTPVVAGDAAGDFCISALRFGDVSGEVVRAFKDKGEQRLGWYLAEMVLNCVYPSWLGWADACTYVSAGRAAVARRGFDHMQILCAAFAELSGLAWCTTLEPPRNIDQRKLGRAERKANMEGRFRALGHLDGARLLLLDDVFTTGATMHEARLALEAAGAQVRCATVLRA